MEANAGVAPAVVDHDGALQKQLTGGSGWFFWIAALSLVNTAFAVMEGDRTFLVGLALTQIADAFAGLAVKDGAPEALRWAAVAFDAVVAGLFAGAGLLGRRRVKWAYLAGMALYVLDAVVCGVFELWSHLGFHALALFFLWRGFSALRQLAPAAPERVAVSPDRPNPLVR